jgi:hypothetical protein
MVSFLVDSLHMGCRPIVFMIGMYLCFSIVYKRKETNMRIAVSLATIRHCIDNSLLASCVFQDDLWKNTGDGWTRQSHGWRKWWCDMVWFALRNVQVLSKRVCVIVHSLPPSISNKLLFVVSNLQTNDAMADGDHLQDSISVTALSFRDENSLNLRSIWSSLGQPSCHLVLFRMTVRNWTFNLPTSYAYVHDYHLTSKSRVWNDGSQKTISMLSIRYNMTITLSNSSIDIELCSFSDQFDPKKRLLIPELSSSRLEFRSDHYIHIKSPCQIRASYVRMLMIPTSCLISLRDGTFHLPLSHYSHTAMALTAQPVMKGQQRCWLYCPVVV